MSFMKWLSILGLAVVSCGCTVRSLYPFYTPEDVVFDSRLLGTWNKIDDSKGETAAWVVLKSSEKSYRVLSAESGVVVLNGTMLRLGSYLYLDLMPAEELLVDYFISAHILLQIDFEGDKLKIAMPDQDKLNQLADMGALSLPHARRDGAVLLCAPPKDLQAFFSQHADDDMVFSPFGEYQRAESTIR